MRKLNDGPVMRPAFLRHLRKEEAFMILRNLRESIMGKFFVHPRWKILISQRTALPSLGETIIHALRMNHALTSTISGDRRKEEHSHREGKSFGQFIRQ